MKLVTFIIIKLAQQMYTILFPGDEIFVPYPPPPPSSDKQQYRPTGGHLSLLSGGNVLQPEEMNCFFFFV